MRVVAACCATSRASLANWAALRSAPSGPGLARNFSNAAFLAFTTAFCRSAKLGSLKLVIRLHHDCVPFAFNRAPCHHRLPLQHVHDITNFPKAFGDVGGYTGHSARRAKLAALPLNRLSLRIAHRDIERAMPELALDSVSGRPILRSRSRAARSQGVASECRRDCVSFTHGKNRGGFRPMSGWNHQACSSG